MKTIKIGNTDRNIAEANELIKQGYGVVLEFGKNPDLDKMNRILTYFNGEYGIEISINHADIAEIIESGIIGGVSGAGAGILYGIIFGGPIGLLALTGGVIGTILGGLSPVLSVTIYKYKGKTFVTIRNSE
ncbi:MAG: hypothetical protein IPN57_07940 [Ignavibacteria bacterium]|nr:hypothetical protein [Ignavibacteria bacterium]